MQCVEDFDIPIYFSHKISRIYGDGRVEKVSIIKVDKYQNDIPGSGFDIKCDTVLISVGLIPENELIEMAGAKMDKTNNTPVSDTVNETSIPGLFVCGNAFKVYDIVDAVSHDSVLAGRSAAEYLRCAK